MRRTPRIASLALTLLLVGMLAAVGCSSRKQVTTADTTPPPAPPAETATTPPPPPPSATETDTETRTAGLEDAYFDFDAAEIRQDAKDALTNNGKYLESHGSSSVVIEGHCDERGSVEYNLALGERRARAAKEFLVSYGIPATRMTTISYGKERPFDSGHDESAWSKNRRAHFVAR